MEDYFCFFILPGARDESKYKQQQLSALLTKVRFYFYY